MSRSIAVFDLDGTITRRDTFLPYLRGWLRRHPRRGWPWIALAALGRYITGGRDRGRLKSELISRLMSGASQPDVAAWTRDFVAGLDAGELCAGALEAIERHRQRGDRLVLLSASVDLYVPAIGSQLGFDETICTGIAWRDGRLDGALTTPNRRGGEKLRCVEMLRARYPGSAFAAYGNSGSDLVHLKAVERPMLVNGGRGARHTALRSGIQVADWRNKSAVAPV